MPKIITEQPVLLADPRVAERYSVCTRTLRRWDQTPELQFPPPRYIRGRRYRDVAELNEWDRANARRLAPARNSTPSTALRRVTR